MNLPSRIFESILSSFADAVIVVDTEKTIGWMNTAAEQMFGISVNQVAGRPVSTLFPENSEIYAELTRAMETRRTLIDHDVTIHASQGDPIPVILSVHPIEEEGEDGAAIAFRNMAGLKAFERSAKLHERVAEIATLAAGIAHEIKNPLSGVRGAAQLLGRDLGGDARSEYTDLIIKESDRIDRLITDLIELNQPGGFPKEPVNIYPILDEVIRLLGAELDGKRITVKRVFDPSLPSVLGDADRLRQIFLNLVKNAVEALGDKGVLTLRSGLAWALPPSLPLNPDKKFALIEVLDDGPGIDESIRPYLFTPFVSNTSGGSGLGLPITLHLVQAHDGLLEVRDRRDDVSGTAALVFLPFVA